MTIRPATEADVPQIVAMSVHFLDTLYAGALVGSAPHLAAFVRVLLTRPTACVLVSVEADRVIGMAVVHVYEHPMSGELVASELAWWVEPERRRAGVRLLRAIEQWARDQGAAVMQMIAPTPRVGAFYTAIGYAPVETLFQRRLA